MNIKYICEWNKIKEKTWSGTTYFLYKSISKKANVEDSEIKLNILQKIIIKIVNNSIFAFKNNVIEFSALRYYFLKNNFKYKIRNMDKNKEIIIQVGDYGISNNSYIYQDLSIDSLLYYKCNKKELFKFSGYDGVPYKDLISRRNKQMQVYSNCRGILTMSEWLARDIIENSGIDISKVHYVGAGININKSRIINKPKNGKRILFVGRDFFRKGGDITYNAFKILKNKYLSDAELYVAGPNKWPLNEQDEGVTFLGDLDYEKLSEYFNKCDIFCLPSRFEAYGLVFAEALVYGLPCIGRNEFAMKEFIQDGYNGYLIDDDNIEVLAFKMFELLNNKKIINNVVFAREQYIEKYSWDAVADRIIKIIKSDINNKT